MQLTIEGVKRDFIPIKTYMSTHNLPVSFGVSYFEPKNYEGLGSIHRAESGAALNGLTDSLLVATPAGLSAQTWLGRLSGLARQFERLLTDINPHIGLQTVEIEFAAAGFEDMLRHYLYAWIRQGSPPDFATAYADWLCSTTRVTTPSHPYRHGGQTWQIQIVSHAYGRVGLIVHRADGVDYVYDNRLACPAERFMEGLLAQVAAKMAV